MAMRSSSLSPAPSACPTRGALRQWAGPGLLATRLAARAAKEEHDNQSSEALESLDALLGTEGEARLPGEGDLQPWWQIKPKQSAPPRRQLMHPPGEVARFVVDSAVYSAKVRSGRSTAVGGELDLPQVQPYFCYLALAAQLAVYAAGTWLGVSHGASAAEEWATALALVPVSVAQGDTSRLATSLLLHGGLTHLALDTFFLGWMGPGVEALLGHGVFLYVYAASGLAGGAAALAAAGGGSAEPLACASAGSVGLVGAMVGYELRNQEVVRQSLRGRRSKAEDGRAGSAALRKPLGAFGVVVAMVALGLVPGSMVSNAAHAGALAAGVGLGWALGPHFSLVREVDIPEGSMMVPENASETVVVLDRRTTIDRVLAGAASAGLLAAAVALVQAVSGGTAGSA